MIVEDEISVKSTNRIVYTLLIAALTISSISYPFAKNISMEEKVVSLSIITVLALFCSLVYFSQISIQKVKYILVLMGITVVCGVMYMQHGDVENTYLFFLMIGMVSIYFDYTLIVVGSAYIFVLNILMFAIAPYVFFPLYDLSQFVRYCLFLLITGGIFAYGALKCLKFLQKLQERGNELQVLSDNMKDGYFQTVVAFSNSIEAKDAYTGGHCQRVMEIACELAVRMDLSDAQIDDLKYAAILHDIGKIGISADILSKEGPLTNEEYNEIKRHPLIAYNILKDVSFLRDALPGILQHHERYDGRGYPYGLKDEEISVFGRILCIADAFDAMTSDRPYRKGMDISVAVKEIDKCRGTYFDPEIASILVNLINESLAMLENREDIG